MHDDNENVTLVHDDNENVTLVHDDNEIDNLLLDHVGLPQVVIVTVHLVLKHFY